jgi:hypothetical protein
MLELYGTLEQKEEVSRKISLIQGVSSKLVELKV